MRETTRDEQFPQEYGNEITGEILETSPSETELVIVSLLMRLYDLNLAILNHLDENRANEIYEAHEKGLHFNPPIFVPEVGSE